MNISVDHKTQKVTIEVDVSDSLVLGPEETSRALVFEAVRKLEKDIEWHGGWQGFTHYYVAP